MTNSIKTRYLCILGSTGSIGMNTLDVVRAHPEQFKVMALTAGQQIDRLALQCLEFKPAIAVLNTTKDAQALSALLRDKGSATTVLFGPE